MSSTGSWQGPFGHAGGFGYQSDASGLQLLGHRYYDPSTGRFLTRDPIKDGRNWYAYGAGEAAPTGMVDPTGLWIVHAVIAVAGLVSLALLADEAQDLIDRGRRNRRNQDRSFGNGDLPGYERGQVEQRVLVEKVRKMHADELAGMYVFPGPIGTIGGTRGLPSSIQPTELTEDINDGAKLLEKIADFASKIREKLAP